MEAEITKKFDLTPLQLGKFVFTTDKCIVPAQLRPGDLLFTCQGTTTEHVSIVTSLAGEAVREVHEVNSTQGWRGLHENDVNLAIGYFVFRCKNEQLASRAAYWAQRWVNEHPEPFAIHRYAKAVDFEKKHAGDLVKSQRKLFNKFGKFRAIKYAARREGQLIYPSEKDPRIEGNRGMFCSMFVVLCFQVAGIEGEVKVAPSGLYVSDKKMEKEDMKSYKERCEGAVNKADLRGFEMYLGHLKEIDPYKLKVKNPKGVNKTEGLVYTPSLEYWGGTTNVEACNWPSLITTGMMVDAKVIMPMGL
ncbi:MAG TPA: hypothetical protein VN828_11575, partial [Acidobacteriaceae bacterium]|nr:hypothetical protein [Acidobacteriaceae bacterium]